MLWTPHKDAKVEALWPHAPHDTITAEVPGRTRVAISIRARRLGVKRLRRTPTPITYPVHPLVAQLRLLRHEQGISRACFSERLGWGAWALNHWEVGRHTPKLPALVDWAQALGYDVVLVPRTNT